MWGSQQANGPVPEAFCVQVPHNWPKNDTQFNGCNKEYSATDKKFDWFYPLFLIFKGIFIHENLKTSVCNKLNALKTDIFIL